MNWLRGFTNRQHSASGLIRTFHKPMQRWRTDSFCIIIRGVTQVTSLDRGRIFVSDVLTGCGGCGMCTSVIFVGETGHGLDFRCADLERSSFVQNASVKNFTFCEKVLTEQCVCRQPLTNPGMLGARAESRTFPSVCVHWSGSPHGEKGETTPHSESPDQCLDEGRYTEFSVLRVGCLLERLVNGLSYSREQQLPTAFLEK